MKIKIIKSNQKERWVKENYKPASFDAEAEIIIDLNKKDQKIWGFRNAMTNHGTALAKTSLELIKNPTGERKVVEFTAELIKGDTVAKLK